jgi:hypothetical protein
MSQIDSLPPNQRAVLSLILQKGRSYNEIATLLHIDEAAVRERAGAALDALGPRDAAPPPAARRTEIGDFLLGQQPLADAERTEAYLAGSAPARAWARAVAGELRPLARIELPAIPGEGAAQPPEAAGPGPLARLQMRSALGDTTGSRPAPSSRRGGAILLAGIAAIAIVIVIAAEITRHSGSNKTFTPTSSTTASGATGATSKIRIVYQINLTPPGKHSHALGIADVVEQGTTLALAIRATGLKPNSPATIPAYGVWLYNTHKDSSRLGYARSVSANGELGAVTEVPADIGDFRALIITQEYSGNGKDPGPIVLAGPFPKHSLK